MFPKNATFIPIIESFPKLLKEGVKEARIRLVNGTTVSGFDHVRASAGLLAIKTQLCVMFIIFEYGWIFLIAFHTADNLCYRIQEILPLPR